MAAIALPAPSQQGAVSLEEALRRRRSKRAFFGPPLTLAEVSSLLFAAQGISHARGLRTAPSAGALYPLELFLAAGAVAGLEPGVYRYTPYTHTLTPSARGDRREDIAAAALGQAWMAEAQALVAFCAVFERITGRYGRRGELYVLIEAGHASQNLSLAAAALGLGSTVVGAFDDARIRAVLGAAGDEHPLILQPVGRPR
jgi:SagB-type dehydrogenase family enzyme